MDSTCIHNPQFNSYYIDSVFSKQFQLLKACLNQKNGLRLQDIISFENSNNFVETSLGHFYTVSESIFPKVNKYKFGNPIRFRRIECPVLDGHVEYFFTKRTKKVKLVLFEWSEFKFRKTDLFVKDTTDPKLGRKTFEYKYDYLVKKVSEQLGQQLVIEQEKDSGRHDTKWKNANGICAYLFMFDNYNEIRLAIYKE